MANERLHDGADLFLGQEGSLDIDLRELRLAIRAQVFVTEALHDLVVAVEARHHQHLLEELRRLWKRVEMPIVQPRGNEEFTRAFGRRLVEERSLDVDEPALVQETA